MKVIKILKYIRKGMSNMDLKEQIISTDKDKPTAECWWCNEQIFGEEVTTIKGYVSCGDKKCVEAIALEAGIVEEYTEIDPTPDYSLVDYVQDHHTKTNEIITTEEQELEFLKLRREARRKGMI